MDAIAMPCRRRYMAGLAAVGVAPGLALAQARAAPRRIGYLSLYSAGSTIATTQQEMFRTALRNAGVPEGPIVTIEWRFAEGRAERLASLAAELVAARVELIVAVFQQAIVAARAATETVPIVALGALLPTEAGFAKSLAQPGGNVTGTVYFSRGVVDKLYELLREAVPRARRIAVLGNPDAPTAARYGAASEEAAARLGLAIEFVHVRRQADVAAALRQVAAARPDALFINGDASINPSMGAIAAFAIERKLPTFGTALVHVREGALLYFGPHLEEMVNRVGSFVARILRGASPATLPMEEPARYELVINSKTAAALGWQPPPALQARVDRFVE
ncbi:ABC transporter substrate-binding protein [Ramlibacter albus]|uniref:ABC transporter substrate-binding protein n=1 Tax=Ramlibacter albus TaxID=2079448 RepID=A0A923MBG0_9BURK|nr:ABC transporter substrate-binding protein [Ramlibacter albus]MBC5765992.1 ABC transporter substrate-binding protein [Ramlibacter albus]